MQRILVDGFNLAFRAFHAMPALTRADGFPTGAIRAWVNILWKLQDAMPGAGVVVFFDKDGSHRHLSLHSGYKATRSETPPDLKKQFPELKKISALLGFRVIEQSGIEADELIASAAEKFSAGGDEVWIASADKDFAQCVTARVRLLVPPAPNDKENKGGWVKLDAGGVREKFGVPPAQIVDYLALIGDTVDNIPGIPGVGPKTAAAWLAKHGDIDGILKNAGALEPVRFREVVPGAKALLDLNRELVRFKTDFTGDWESEMPADFPAAREFFVSMNMGAAVKEIDKRAGNVAPEKPPAPKNSAQTQLELF